MCSNNKTMIKKQETNQIQSQTIETEYKMT